MELLSSFAYVVAAFLVVLTVLVFVHELGHYWIARWTGVRVEVFSIGFGPEIRGWTDRHGTRWKISAVPLGGYVKMFGESESIAEEDGSEREMTPEERAVSFHHKPLRRRAAVVVGGPAANYVFAILLYIVLFATVGVSTLNEENAPSVVGNVFAGSAAADAGLEPGDKILSIDGKQVHLFRDLSRIISAKPDAEIVIELIRDGQPMTIRAVPTRELVPDGKGGTLAEGRLGIGNPAVVQEPQPILKSIVLGIEQPFFLSYRILQSVGQMIAGERSVKQLGGPIRIAQISGQAAHYGLKDLLFIMAALSVNLGLINLFPIPLLDGGHLAFYAVEAARGRPLGERAQEYGFRLGLVLVIGLFLFVTWNDLARFSWNNLARTPVFEFITGLFT